MTVEIGILNKEAVAMAADSAVTVSRGRKQKIFTSANKIFALSKYHPVGIMVYGSSLFMHTPWETIIKIYRKKLAKTKFDTLEEYGKDFINYLSSDDTLFPPTQQKRYLVTTVQGYFLYQIVYEIEERVKDAISKKETKQIDEDEALGIAIEVIKKHSERWDKAKVIPSVKDDSIVNIKNNYGKIIESIVKNIFEKIHLTEEQLKQLISIAENLFIKCPNYLQYDSGVVIAGFGEKDIFPSLISYYMDGVIDNRLIYKEHTISKIGFDKNSSIVPFAQPDMIATFMEGIHPDYKKNIIDGFSKVFELYPIAIIDAISKLTEDEKKELKEKTKKIGTTMFEKLQEEISKYQHDNFIGPVTRIVSILPKDELASMAETLINLTSFKRKISEEAETVGGPIDVAVISKGDGFVWIKRKHYFKPELNPHFSKNYYMEE